MNFLGWYLFTFIFLCFTFVAFLLLFIPSLRKKLKLSHKLTIYLILICLFFENKYFSAMYEKRENQIENFKQKLDKEELQNLFHKIDEIKNSNSLNSHLSSMQVLQIMDAFKEQFNKWDDQLRKRKKIIPPQNLNLVYYELLDVSLDFKKDLALFKNLKWSLASLFFQLDLLNYTLLNPQKLLYPYEIHSKIIDLKIKNFKNALNTLESRKS